MTAGAEAKLMELLKDQNRLLGRIATALEESANVAASVGRVVMQRMDPRRQADPDLTPQPTDDDLNAAFLRGQALAQQEASHPAIARAIETEQERILSVNRALAAGAVMVGPSGLLELVAA